MWVVVAAVAVGLAGTVLGQSSIPTGTCPVPTHRSDEFNLCWGGGPLNASLSVTLQIRAHGIRHSVAYSCGCLSAVLANKSKSSVEMPLCTATVALEGAEYTVSALTTLMQTARCCTGEAHVVVPCTTTHAPTMAAAPVLVKTGSAAASPTFSPTLPTPAPIRNDIPSGPCLVPAPPTARSRFCTTPADFAFSKLVTITSPKPPGQLAPPPWGYSCGCLAAYLDSLVPKAVPGCTNRTRFGLYSAGALMHAMEEYGCCTNASHVVQCATPAPSPVVHRNTTTASPTVLTRAPVRNRIPSNAPTTSPTTAPTLGTDSTTTPPVPSTSARILPSSSTSTPTASRPYSPTTFAPSMMAASAKSSSSTTHDGVIIGVTIAALVGVVFTVLVFKFVVFSGSSKPRHAKMLGVEHVEMSVTKAPLYEGDDFLFSSA
eukprot:m.415903 g.415903  ORF g.415903 m.415903 type:complete len:430 (-) comp29759_c0_seq1:78-1367(-)